MGITSGRRLCPLTVLSLASLLALPSGCSSSADKPAADQGGLDAGDMMVAAGDMTAEAGVSEQCDNQKDDDGDGQADCADQDCLLDPLCSPWQIVLTSGDTAGALDPGLLGQYDLSGALFSYDQVSGLKEKMAEAGLSQWRVGVGRWEAGTLLFPQLSDGSQCNFAAGMPQEAFVPSGWSDEQLLAARDWFTFTDGQAVTVTDTQDDARYNLGYIRSVIDTANALGAEPYLDIDLMPRALAVNQTPDRTAETIADPCNWSFTNQVSNTQPANPAVFASAVVGMVQRVLSGSGGEAGRWVGSWEVWNEPEFCTFWDPRPKDGTPCSQELVQDRMPFFFNMALPVLVALDNYRQHSDHPRASELRFGLGSFSLAEAAVATIAALDTEGSVPLDFLSFHAYTDDPLEVVDRIKAVAAARDSSQHYKDLQLVLAEWGPDLQGQMSSQTMDPALHAATVIALGAQVGLGRAFHALFWQYYGPSEAFFWLLGHDLQPMALYYAYSMLAPLVSDGSERLEVQGADQGRLDQGLGAVLASRAADGSRRVLLINRGPDPRPTVVLLDGEPVTPQASLTLSDPQLPPSTATPTSPQITVPARSIVLLSL